MSVAGPGVSSACVPAPAPVEICRKLCGWGETECELYRGYEPCTLSTLYNTLHTQYAPNLGLDGEIMGQMCQCVSVLFLWTLELWTSHHIWNKHETYSTNGIKAKLVMHTFVWVGITKGFTSSAIVSPVTCHLTILMHGLPGYMDLLHKNVIKYQ